jgi:hypothetical protein
MDRQRAIKQRTDPNSQARQSISKAGPASSLKDFIEEKKLGEGAYSHVLKVMRKADNQLYALKKVNIA